MVAGSVRSLLHRRRQSSSVLLVPDLEQFLVDLELLSLCRVLDLIFFDHLVSRNSPAEMHRSKYLLGFVFICLLAATEDAVDKYQHQTAEQQTQHDEQHVDDQQNEEDDRVGIDAAVEESNQWSEEALVAQSLTAHLVCVSPFLPCT